MTLTFKVMTLQINILGHILVTAGTIATKF